jgi:hypothetical protein
MTTLERMGKMLDAIFFSGNCDFWGRELVVALFPRLMLASIIRERSEQQKTSGSFYARRFETCMLCIIEDGAQMSQDRW